jgi:phosphoglycerate dehydrogenase-like enzyme
VSKEELLHTADVISIHMVLSPRTTGLIGAAEFALMRRRRAIRFSVDWPPAAGIPPP